MSAIDWGDVPTWLAAIATVCALIAAGLAVRKASETFDLELKRDAAREAQDFQQRKHEEQAEQADLIAAWPATMSEQFNIQGNHVGALIMNSSHLPVYDVNVMFHNVAGGLLATVPLPLLPPGAEEVQRPPVVPKEFGIALRFRDAAGRVWERNQQGKLSKWGYEVVIDDAEGGSDSIITKMNTSAKPTDPPT